MAKLPDKSGGDAQTTEKHIASMVKRVREDKCEQSFLEIKEYLDYYVKLFGKKYKIAGHDSDEIEQECVIALRYKAIEDLDPARGKFKSFAILCIKRHLFSIIKSNNQQKRKVLNQSLSLNEDRSEDGENLALIAMIAEGKPTVDEQAVKSESILLLREKLLAKLSPLEKEVFKLYVQQYHYDEIAEKLQEMFPDKNYNKKTTDNALQRLKLKAQSLPEIAHLFENI